MTGMSSPSWRRTLDGFHSVPQRQVVVGEDDVVGCLAHAFGKLLPRLCGRAVAVESGLVQAQQA